MIVKVQKPIGGNRREMFVYNEDKSIMVFVPPSKRLVPAGELKTYWHAELRGHDLAFLDRAPAQAW